MKQKLTLIACLAGTWAFVVVAAHADAPQTSGAGAVKTSDHWSYRQVVRPIPPVVRGDCRTAVDRFILARLETKVSRFNPEADRETLIRRVSFDLTGLPPTFAEIDRYLADRSANAYERMVERYLASPRYGEHWGKHWLDATGYADSNGYFNADSDRPLAWRYRDYVISAFNRDVPFNQFVMEQIAGDELAGFTPDGDVTPDMVEPLTATHFLRNAPDGTGESDGNPDEVRTDRFSVLEGNLQNAMNCLLGLTIQCARCHNHKFEPISQAEYYRLQAIFFPVYNPDRWLAPNARFVNVASRAERIAWQKRNELISRQVKAATDGLKAFAETLRAQLRDERMPVSDKDLIKRFPEYAALRKSVELTVKAREKERPRPLERIAAYVEIDPKPAVHHVLHRGQHNQPDREVQPGVPAAFSTPANTFHVEPRPAGHVSTGRRSAFARWITSPENPLFARVMVNRVWQHHFGTGLVSTPDNLGQSGAKPSHPELIDYLAAEFVRSSWSVKRLHRLILHSAVYRQSSSSRADLDEVDPEHRLLGRFPLRRLDAESLRDAMLHVAGELDTRTGGPYIPSQRSADGTVEMPENIAGARRRSVYLQQRRTQTLTLLQLFDAPSMVSTCGKRSPSTVPLQPLALLNSAFARSRARAFAQRLAREAGADAQMRLTLAFRLAYGRPPLEAERTVCRRFLEKQRMVYTGDKDGERSWADLAQMILASNAFLYVE